MSTQTLIDTYEGEKYVLEIHNDDCCESPRDWVDSKTLICWHSRYRIGDSHKYSDFESFTEDVREEDNLILPVYMLDHSGISLSTTKFSCPWDSGQVGYIYMSHDEIVENFGKLDDESISKATLTLKSEVDIYSKYLNGDVYMYTLYEKCPTCNSKSQVIDSCGGFYGYDIRENGILDSFTDDVKNDLKI